MKINVDKLDSTIAKLQELRRLATDPALAPFVRVTGQRSRNGNTPAESEAARNGRGQLKAAVLAACQRLGEFTIKEVVAAMESEGEVNARSVANVLRTLSKDGKIRVVLENSGRRPTKYAA
jgi:ribosomal protein L28